jgi:hypothetical protein
MNNIRNNRILALSLILSHLLGFGFHSVFHMHPVVCSGAQEQQLFPHEDAAHCKHLPLNDQTECTICLSAQSRILPDQPSLNLGNVQVVGTSSGISSAFLTHGHLLGFFSRRGPPFLLG